MTLKTRLVNHVRLGDVQGVEPGVEGPWHCCEEVKEK